MKASKSSVATHKAGRPASQRSFRPNQDFTDLAIYEVLKGIDSPRSLTVWILYKNKEHSQLVNLSCDPLSYLDPFQFRGDYAATELLSKADFLDLDIDRSKIAIEKFLKAERQCAETNRRLSYRTEVNMDDSLLAPCLLGLAWKISAILGDFDPNEFVDSCGWGPGATTSLKRSLASSYNKFRTQTGATSSCATFISPWFFKAYPSWARSIGADFFSIGSHLPECFDIQVGNKVTTVPKSAKTDRVICIEPALNLWFQKGVGRMIRNRLRRKGNPIDRQDRNQQMCAEAVRRQLATVDFSSASDTIAYQLIQLILPEDWLIVMNSLRSPSGVLNGTIIRWEKFSTMGNGFTFELETLIFWALALYVCDVYGEDPSKVSVFGDDVILPVKCLDLFTRLAGLLGFTVNEDKTHSSSLFRESCGVHYFANLDVKPLYIKRLVKSADEAFSLINGVRLLSHRWNLGFGCDSRFRSCWIRLLHRIPKDLWFFGPMEFGDSVITSNWDECAPARARNGLEGWIISILNRRSRDRDGYDFAIALSRILEIGSSDLDRGNSYPLPGPGPLRVLRRVLARSWHDLGPWA
jgi:hypothetical protein